MKKPATILLTLLILFSALAIYVSAASENTPVTFYSVNVKPVLDGIVKPGEYGEKIHSVDYKSDEFLDVYDEYHKVKADFYGTWTEEGVYLAWVAHSDVHVATTYNSEMWRYCVIQFCTTPINPVDADPGNCNELGICVSSENGQPYKWVYNGPADVEDWEYNGKRNEKAKTTTYETFFPWKAIAMGIVGKVGSQIGVAYALGEQEDFTVENCMVEWQDAILGGKNYPSSAVVTLAAAKSSAPVAAATADNTAQSAAPKTADTGIIVTFIAMAISAGAVLCAKRRK